MAPSVRVSFLSGLRLPPCAHLAYYAASRNVIMFVADWALNYFREIHGDVELLTSAPEPSAS